MLLNQSNNCVNKSDTNLVSYTPVMTAELPDEHPGSAGLPSPSSQRTSKLLRCESATTPPRCRTLGPGLPTKTEEAFTACSQGRSG